MNENQTPICCDCGNYINHKPRYTSEDFESRSPYCQTCWDESVSEEEEEEELTLKSFTFLTGNQIQVIAKTEAEALEILGKGGGFFLEADTRLTHVGNA